MQINDDEHVPLAGELNRLTLRGAKSGVKSPGSALSPTLCLWRTGTGSKWDDSLVPCEMSNTTSHPWVDLCIEEYQKP